MNDDLMEQIKPLAEARGMRVEKGPDDGQFLMYKGDSFVGDVYYVEQFRGWVGYDPTEELGSLLDQLEPPSSRKRFRRETVYHLHLTFHHGRRISLNYRSDWAAKLAILEALDKLVPVLAPKAVRVSLNHNISLRKLG